MRIKTLHIKYFRSIYNEKIELGDLNILAGLNDTGKSNILKALNLFFNGETGWREPFDFKSDFNHQRRKEFEVPRNQRPKNAQEISITVIFQEYGNTIPVWTKTWRLDGIWSDIKYDQNTRKSERNSNTGFRPYSKVPSMLNKVSYNYVPALKGPEFISHLIGKLSSVLSERASDDIRQAAAGFEDNLGTHFSDITTLIKDELDLQSLLKLPQNLIGIFENMEFSDHRGIALSHRGDGIRTRHIPILLHKISTLHDHLKEGSELYDHFLWGYEEPENNVELSACIDMARKFAEYSTKYQILLTTHSPAFYSIPEQLNYSDENINTSLIRYQTILNGGSTKYELATQDDLDPYFLLPAVSRHFQKYVEENRNLKSLLRSIEEEGIDFRKPAIFFEGKSDYLVFKKAIKLFFPQITEDSISLYYPKSSEHGGGASYVKDHLIVWEHMQKHVPKVSRFKCFGIFDHDDEGNSAKSEFEKFVKHPLSTFARTYLHNYPNNSHLMRLKTCELKYSPNITLEILYSPEFWQVSKDQNWLKERSMDNIRNEIPDPVLAQLTTSEKCIDDLEISPELKIYFTHCFKDYKKIDAAGYISNSIDHESLKQYLILFESLLPSIFKKLEIDIVENQQD